MSQDTNSQEYLDLKTELRSLLISSQQGCNESQLIRDYAAYNAHKSIPFGPMGYRNLIELLRSMPDVAKIEQSKSLVIIHGVPDQNTAHIKRLVMKQKTKKKPGNGRGGMGNYSYGNTFNTRPNGPSMYPRNRQGPSYSIANNGIPFQPYTQIPNPPKNLWDPPNLTNVSYTTPSYPMNSFFPNPIPPPVIGISKPSTNSGRTLASFPPKESPTPPIIPSEITSMQATPTNDDVSSVTDGDLNGSEEEDLAAYDTQRASEHGEKIILLRKHVRQLLLKYPNGLWLSNFHKAYKKLYKDELNLEDYKLKNLMAFFNCVSDFVDSQRDRLPDSTDRILLLKQNFTEVVKREQQRAGQNSESTVVISSPSDAQTPFRSLNHEIDLSSFVPVDFQYKSIDYTSTEPFQGFLGDVEDPWNLHIGNIQFISKRDQMMAELQDHYNRSSNQSIYLIPFEQIQIYLSCVYYHTDKRYYRAFIYHIDPTPNNEIVILKLYLVDYGMIISNITYHINATNLKFLHRNFSTLSTQVYDCRLANVSFPPTSIQWPEDARQFIVDLCKGMDLRVEIVGTMEPFYSIYLSVDQQSINQLLIHHDFAIEHDDSQYPEFQSLSPKAPSNHTNNSINGKFSSPAEQHSLDYNLEENNYKHFTISIEHVYYFIKHPFTQRPCLPCFEVARLLNQDEGYVSRLNLVREQAVYLKDSDRMLFDHLRSLDQSKRCPHIHQRDEQAMIVIYDLSSIRDYLLKIRFKDGDVIDAFQEEYDNYQRLGYWNEKKNCYHNQENLQTHQEDLYQRRNLFNFRREQLVSLSKTSPNNLSTGTEMQTIENGLHHINEELHSMESILPSAHQPPPPPIVKIKSRDNKMRETCYRIARPFDQQFSLNLRFNHQFIDSDQFNDDSEEDLEGRLEDLYRITKNVIQFFVLESEVSDEKKRVLLAEVENLSPDLMDKQLSQSTRIEAYNHCLQIVEYFQPIIRYYVQRTDLIDTIY